MADKENEKDEAGGEPEGAPLIGPLNLSHLREVIQMCRENDIAELKVKHLGTTIHIKGRGSAAPVEYVVATPAAAPPAPPVPVAAEAAPAPEPTAPEEVESKYVTVRSPMVGTFFRSPAPDAPPFVEVDDSVTESTVLCIIEAMKLLNEIKAETRGMLAKILVENAQPVEYNQPLFLIKPE